MKGCFFDPKHGFVRAELKKDGLRIIPGSVLQGDPPEGWWWSPPFVDLYAFLPDPGYEYREDRQSFSNAAYAGGYGAVMCRPETRPVIDNASMAMDFIGSGHKETRIIPLPAFSIGLKGVNMSELGDIAGLDDVWGVTHGETPVRSDLFLRHVMEYARNFGLTVLLTPYHGELDRGIVNEGVIAARLGLDTDSRAGEEIAINRYLVLARLTRARLHIAKVSTAGGVELIRQAKARGVDVTASVAFYNLILTDREMQTFDQDLVVKPPLRSEHDRQALLQGLRDGTIDAVVSDHTPVSVNEKQMELAFTLPGMVGLEFVFPVLMDLVNQGDLTIKDVMRVLITGPMSISGVAPSGLLRMERTADAGPVTIRSKSRNTPFRDRQFSAGVKWVAVY